ncbi:FkbM family methyltransferase [Pannus brasiliensis CCIBt3594]|uniref:FkbM family methyltransferase n=1 Tax=Pannus brasiliensis CCIBt3594 TaxID=1427578 RepID=A0AAW9QXI3_9CHRO
MDKNLIKNLLKKENPIVLEIGAHRGTDTLDFLQKFSEIEIHSFEPDPRIIKLHRQLVSDRRSKLHEIAISDEEGEATFYQSGEAVDDQLKYDASSSLKKPKEHLTAYPNVKFNNSITVPTVRLDTWARENNISEIDFIWADVQGAEEQLIKGGLETLKKTKYFYTEYSDRELYENQINLNKIKELLPSFEFICFYASNVLFKNTRYIQSPLEVLSERIYTNYYIYTHDRSYFRLPFKTGLRKLANRLTGTR